VRLAKVPGFGAESAQQMIAEVGVDAEAHPRVSSPPGRGYLREAM
jgi:hypothetical protein